LENLTQEESGLYLGSDTLCARTKASSEYIFQGGIHTSHRSVYVNMGNNINNINSRKLNQSQ
jgi:hypothetical protein